ncbi:MAG: hypothetical protein U5R46_06270 [Gammaproteobacteria bacterium]|nr:hypothetical protein [Gammaproteobacteria bacterium]
MPDKPSTDSGEMDPPPQPPESIGLVAERIRARSARTDFEGALRVTVSLGLAGSRAEAPREAMTRRADRALYQTRETGRNCRAAAPDAAGAAAHEDAGRGNRAGCNGYRRSARPAADS